MLVKTGKLVNMTHGELLLFCCCFKGLHFSVIYKCYPLSRRSV